jgi:hypothetical protein
MPRWFALRRSQCDCARGDVPPGRWHGRLRAPGVRRRIIRLVRGDKPRARIVSTSSNDVQNAVDRRGGNAYPWRGHRGLHLPGVRRRIVGEKIAGRRTSYVCAPDDVDNPANRDGVGSVFYRRHRGSFAPRICRRIVDLRDRCRQVARPEATKGVDHAAHRGGRKAEPRGRHGRLLSPCALANTHASRREYKNGGQRDDACTSGTFHRAVTPGVASGWASVDTQTKSVSPFAVGSRPPLSLVSRRNGPATSGHALGHRSEGIGRQKPA